MAKAKKGKKKDTKKDEKKDEKKGTAKAPKQKKTTTPSKKPSTGKKPTEEETKSESTSKKKTEKKPKKSPSKKKNFECQYCGKRVTTEHNLKVHEHHCKSKSEAKEEKEKGQDVEVAIRRLRDEFEDQRDAMTRETAAREDMLRDEIRELKEVLRLEIQRTHHMPAPHPTPVEETPAEKPAEVISTGEGPVEEVPEPAIEEVPDVVPEAETVPEPEPAAEEPGPIPETEQIPEPALAPEPTPVPVISEPIEAAPISEQLAMEKPHPPKVDHLPIPEDTEPVEPAPAEEPPREDAVVEPAPEDDISGLVRDEMETPGAVSAEPVSAISNEKLEKITSRIDELSSELFRFTMDTNDRYDSLSKKINQQFEELNIKRFEREMEKMSERVFDIMDEVGFGESLNVSKIPPNILEIVYEATLEDIVRELTNSLGNQEAEREINSALEDVRLKTSGSELFRFDGRKIVTENLARSLESHMISAKQIQTTYSELLKKLLDNVPHHKAKNFRAMIKIKSQEFAVDKATHLINEVGRLENFAETTSQMIAALSSQVSARAVQMENEFEKMNEALSTKMDAEQLEIFNNKFDSSTEASMRFSEDVGTMKAEVEMLRGILEDTTKQMETLAKTSEAPKPKKEEKSSPSKKDSEKKDEEKPKKEKKEAKPGVKVKDEPEEPVSEDIPQEEEAKETSPREIDEKVLKAIGGGASSKTAITEKTELARDDVIESLERLVSKNKLIQKGTKKRPSYHTPEKEFAEVVKKETASKKKKPEPKKDIKAKKEPREEPKKEKPKKEKSSPSKKDLEKQEKKPDEKKKKEKKKQEEKKVKKEEKKAKKEIKPKAEPKKEKPKEDKKPAKAKEDKPEPKAKDEKPKAKKAKAKEPAEEETAGEEPVKDTKETPQKDLKDLVKDEKIVYDAITESGITLTNLRKVVEKDVKYTTVLRTLRILIDSGLVGVMTKGRHTMYQKITVEEKDKKSKKKLNKEVK